MNRLSRSILVLTILAAVLLVTLGYLRQSMKVEGWNDRPQLVESKNSSSIIRRAQMGTIDGAFYEDIFRSVAEAVHLYSKHSSAWVVYPGVPGTRGLSTEGLEGYARSGVLIASWLYGGRAGYIELDGGAFFDLKLHLLNGLKNGTDRESPGYWGNIEDYDQRIVEAADVALIVWMLYERNMLHLSENELSNVLSWLKQIDNKAIYGGNWNLFPLIVYQVLGHVDNESSQVYQERMSGYWKQMNASYVGDGWYSDGVGGRLDLYNAWQMHYLIFWLDKMDSNIEGFERGVVRDRLHTFAKNYIHLITSDGFPIFGRSICYRLSIATPLFASYLTPGTSLNAGQVRAGSDAIMSYFVSRGALEDGLITQGYCSAETKWIENYAGRASCLWGLRGLVLMFLTNKSDAIWQATPGKLPVEERDFSFSWAEGAIKVQGKRDLNTVVLQLEQTRANPVAGILDYMPEFTLKYLEYMFERPLRRGAFDKKYGESVYKSNEPFCGCVVE